MEKTKLQFLEESLSEAMIKIYREAMLRQKKVIIDKACEWIKEHIDIPYEGRMIDGEPEAADYIEWAKERLKCAEEVAEAFRKAMEE